MGEWTTLESPRLRLPLELREVAASAESRVFEVQELRKGCVFKVTLRRRAPNGGAVRPVSDADLVRAVCVAVEEAMLSPPEKEPGMTYEITVGGREKDDTVEMPN